VKQEAKVLDGLLRETSFKRNIGQYKYLGKVQSHRPFSKTISRLSLQSSAPRKKKAMRTQRFKNTDLQDETIYAQTNTQDQH